MKSAQDLTKTYHMTMEVLTCT